MSASLSSLIDNLPERVHCDKCTDFKSCLEYGSFKNNQLIFKCPKCNKNHNKGFNKELINRFSGTYEFCDRNTNKFTFLVKKRSLSI